MYMQKIMQKSFEEFKNLTSKHIQNSTYIDFPNIGKYFSFLKRFLKKLTAKKTPFVAERSFYRF